MASFVYDHAKFLLLEGLLDFQEASDDIRIALVMTNTTVDTEKAKATISAFTTLDEYDGANYARKACANQAVTEVGGSNLGKFSFDAITWTALGIGTRQCQGLLLYKHVTNDADSIPIAFIDTGGFPFDGNGGNVTLTPNAAGFLQAT